MNAPDDQATRNAGTYAALFGLLIAGLVLLFLTAIVLPQVLGIVIVLGLFLGFGAFHYVVWGWWLERMGKEESFALDENSDPNAREI